MTCLKYENLMKGISAASDVAFMLRKRIILTTFTVTLIYRAFTNTSHNDPISPS